MKKSNIKTTVDSALILSAAGVLAAFPFRDHFLGGLLFSTCNAAAIGGLADSFAVGALFGNPLKIKWPTFMGTRVIARNRNRLIHELGHMVQHELLTTVNIQARLNEYSISTILIRYLQEHGGKEDIASIAGRLAEEFIVKIDVPGLVNMLKELLLGNPEAIQVADIAADVGEWTIRNGYDERVIDFFIHELIRIVNTERFRLVLERLASSVLTSYEHGNFRRQFVNIAAGLEPDSISGKIQTKIEAFLKEMLLPEHAQRMKLKAQMSRLSERLRSDQKLRESIEHKKLDLVQVIKEHIQLDIYIQRFLDTLRSQYEDADGTELQLWINRQIEQEVNKLSSSEATLQELDHRIKGIVLHWIEQKHSAIAKVVTDKLSTYSEQELTELVQDKAGRDLQYIRLNGVAIGGLIGAVLYLLTFFIKGGVW